MFKYLLITFLVINTPILFAQESRPLQIKQTDQLISVDGKIDEIVWKDVDPINLVMFQPNFNEQATEKSEVRIVYDQQYLYIAANLYDKEPEKIQITTRKRDDWHLSNDIFGIVLDTFNDKENGLCFNTNPASSHWHR